MNVGRAAVGRLVFAWSAGMKRIDAFPWSTCSKAAWLPRTPTSMRSRPALPIAGQRAERDGSFTDRHDDEAMPAFRVSACRSARAA